MHHTNLKLKWTDLQLNSNLNVFFWEKYLVKKKSKQCLKLLSDLLCSDKVQRSEISMWMFFKWDQNICTILFMSILKLSTKCNAIHFSAKALTDSYLDTLHTKGVLTRIWHTQHGMRVVQNHMLQSEVPNYIKVCLMSQILLQMPTSDYFCQMTLTLHIVPDYSTHNCF